MEYRTNRRTGDKIGTIGFGTSAVCEADGKEIAETLALAFESGVNYYDLATSNAKTFPAFGDAFAGVRGQVFYQVHFGADYSAGEYGWTTDGDAVKRSVEWQLKNLKTDYIDYAFIHCIDEESDWARYRKKRRVRISARTEKDGCRAAYRAFVARSRRRGENIGHGAY